MPTTEKVTEVREGWSGRPYKEAGRADPLSGMSDTSFWLSPDHFARMFHEGGFAMFRWLKPPAPHENGGLAGQFMATR